MQDAPARAASIWRNRAIDAGCALFAALPLFLTVHLPLYDLPNHIAMLHVLLEDGANLVLNRIYGVHWVFVPNMGLQVFAWLLNPLLGVEPAVRLFCITTVLLLCAGTRALALALSKGAPNLRLYRVAPFICWGGPMQFGFVSYCFGIGLMLFCLAIYLRARTRPALLIWGLFAPICVLLLATHLMAFGLFLCSLAGLELAETLMLPLPLRTRAIWLMRRTALIVAFAAPALCLLLLAAPLQSTAAPGFNAAAKPGFSLLYKAESIAAITWFAMPGVEVPLLLLAACCAGSALLLRWIRPAGLMVGMVGVVGLVWLALPRGIPASYYVDYRVPWAICFIALAGLFAGPQASRPPNVIARCGMTCALAVLVVIRIASVSLRWLHCEPELAAIDDALKKLPEGTSLWVVKGVLPGKLMKTPPLEHAAADIVPLRNGFETEIFAGAAGQMVYLRPSYLPLYRMEAVHDLLGLPPGYDAVLVLYPDQVQRAIGLNLREVSAGPHFILLRRQGGTSSLARIPPH